MNDETTRGMKHRSPYNNDNALCADHRYTFDLPDAVPVRSRFEQEDDPSAPIECDACSMFLMKRAES